MMATHGITGKKTQQRFRECSSNVAKYLHGFKWWKPPFITTFTTALICDLFYGTPKTRIQANTGEHHRTPQNTTEH